MLCLCVCAGSVSRTSFWQRYLVSVCLLLYAMLMGSVRTATLGFVTVLNPITGEQGFAYDLHVDVNADSVRALRRGCAAALVLFG